MQRNNGFRGRPAQFLHYSFAFTPFIYGLQLLTIFFNFLNNHKINHALVIFIDKSKIPSDSNEMVRNLSIGYIILESISKYYRMFPNICTLQFILLAAILHLI